MSIHRIAAFATASLLLAACSSENSAHTPPGSEGGRCYGNGSCDEGLVCRSGLCVEPDTEADGAVDVGGVAEDGPRADAGIADAGIASYTDATGSADGPAPAADATVDGPAPTPDAMVDGPAPDATSDGPAPTPDVTFDGPLATIDGTAPMPDTTVDGSAPAPDATVDGSAPTPDATVDSAPTPDATVDGSALVICASLSFAGAGGVEVADAPGLDPGTGDFTVEAWIKSTDSAGHAVISKRLGENYYTVWARNNMFNIWFVTSPGVIDGYTPTFATAPDLTKWSHVVVQRASGTMSFYLDGKKAQSVDNASPSTNNVSNSGPLYIGRQLLGENMTGQVAEVRITNAAVYSGDFTPPATLIALPQTVALYHFDEAQGSTLLDSSGNAHDGTISGASWVGDCPAGCTACASGDGCCPAGCNTSPANADSDCPTVCGNGIKEDDEACDTAITTGQAGACPISCDDGQACTADALANVGTCQSACVNTAITACGGGDGCCPAGCNVSPATADDDCPADCGNGVLEPLEECDDENDADGDGCSADCELEQPTAMLFFDGQLVAELPITDATLPGDVWFNITGVARGIQSADAKLDDVQVTGPASASLLDEDFSSSTGWKVCSGSAGSAGISGGTANIDSDYGIFAHTAGSFGSGDYLSIKAETYWSGQTNRFRIYLHPAAFGSSCSGIHNNAVLWADVDLSMYPSGTTPAPRARIGDAVNATSVEEALAGVPAVGWHSLELLVRKLTPTPSVVCPSDGFDTPGLCPSWTVTPATMSGIPQDGGSYAIDGGYMKHTFPSGCSNGWCGKSFNAPVSYSGAFSAEARYEVAGSGDSDMFQWGLYAYAGSTVVLTVSLWDGEQTEGPEIRADCASGWSYSSGFLSGTYASTDTVSIVRDGANTVSFTHNGSLLGTCSYASPITQVSYQVRRWGSVGWPTKLWTDYLHLGN